MKAAFLCCILLLAGSASCSPAEANSINLVDLNIPDWIADLIGQLPDSIQNIIDKLPEIIAAIPGILGQIPAIIAQIIEKIPEIIPIILDKLPEIIAQVPELIKQIVAIIRQIIEKIPELIPIILEKIPEIIEAIPGIIDQIKEILEIIKDKLDEIELPDWFPTLPDLEKPEWWPDEIPTLPEYNPAVAGTAATVSEFPGIVQIEIGAGFLWAQGCGGSILTSLHVLSAARCFAGIRYSPRFRRIRAGSSTRYTDGSVVAVDSAINHPNFGQGSSEADITVVRLLSSLTLGDTIQQTPIVADGFTLPAALSVVTAGWGSTAQGKRFADRNLYQIELTVVDNTECASRWGKNPIFTITDSMICSGRIETGGRNGDVRDIGSPVYYQNTLVGVLSFSAHIGNQYFPLVATSVGSYTNWIVANAI